MSTQPTGPAEHTKPYRQLIAFVLLAGTAVFLLVAFARLLLVFENFTSEFTERAQVTFTDFVGPLQIIAPLVAVLIATHVRPVVPMAKVITVVAVVEIVFEAVFGFVCMLAGVAYTVSDSEFVEGDLRSALETLFARLALLAFVFVAGFVAVRSLRAAGGPAPAYPYGAGAQPAAGQPAYQPYPGAPGVAGAAVAQPSATGAMPAAGAAAYWQTGYPATQPGAVAQPTPSHGFAVAQPGVAPGAAQPGVAPGMSGGPYGPTAGGGAAHGGAVHGGAVPVSGQPAAGFGAGGWPGGPGAPGVSGVPGTPGMPPGPAVSGPAPTGFGDASGHSSSAGHHAAPDPGAEPTALISQQPTAQPAPPAGDRPPFTSGGPEPATAPLSSPFGATPISGVPSAAPGSPVTQPWAQPAPIAPTSVPASTPSTTWPALPPTSGATPSPSAAPTSGATPTPTFQPPGVNQPGSLQPGSQAGGVQPGAPYGLPPAPPVAPPFGPATSPSVTGPGMEGESTTVLRPGQSAPADEPTRPVQGDEPTARVNQPADHHESDDEGQRTQVIRPQNP